MTHIGIDIEQFTRDPYGSGIQRVLAELARHWPSGLATAEFVVPVDRGFGLLTPDQAAQLLDLAFEQRQDGQDLRERVARQIAEANPVVVRPGDLLSIFDSWLLPEVSYLPSVLERFTTFSRCMPTAMIGYDVLPMSEPANYRFAPGTAAWVSEYFRHLATADAVACISEHSRQEIMGRLRRNPVLITSVVHPGGDHGEHDRVTRDERLNSPPMFLRVGTLEARKHPREILAAFRTASDDGLKAELVFVGAPSASDEAINQDLMRATTEGIGVTWSQGASDDEVQRLIQRADAFLSIGVEGYGIPVLEALKLGTPVLYDGIQPAAELLEGRGARHIEAMSPGDLSRALAYWSEGDRLRVLRSEIELNSVPTWADYAEGVVRTCLRA